MSQPTKQIVKIGVLLLILVIPAVLIPLHLGLITKFTDLVTQVVAMVVGTLICSGIALLFGGLVLQKEKPVSPRSEKPALTISLAEAKNEGEVKELEVRFPGRVRRTRKVCFYYVTVKARGRRTVENVLAYCDGEQLRIVPRTEKSSFGIDWNGYSVEEFDKGGANDFITALLREERKTKDAISFVHPGAQGQSFVLFFTVEGRQEFYIPAATYLWYNPRTGLCGHGRDDGTGTVKLSLHLAGQDAESCDATFEVAFEKWNSFKVKPVRLTNEK
jgi:hypothetical protein